MGEGVNSYGQSDRDIPGFFGDIPVNHHNKHQCHDDDGDDDDNGKVLRGCRRIDQPGILVSPAHSEIYHLQYT